MRVRHKMSLAPQPFQKILSGEKTFELRLWDRKRRLLKAGDIIEFTEASPSGASLNAEVLALHVFDTFEELYQTLPLNKIGYSESELSSASYKDMEKYYPREEQEKHRVVAIEIRLLEPTAPRHNHKAQND